jgi:hypothetical protein
VLGLDYCVVLWSLRCLPVGLFAGVGLVIGDLPVCS